ncbi:MAG: MerR family DNA-binding transcriptional regulator [Lactobacillus sp.]|jgi:DNA-binding transcriptional MerR regulator|nr:MerR family DNA-binding transcriptional regulator [Lactobacillus sp.]MCI2032504.1 MerR family DNA-binding transcriptional regulator [Lactobacillus sp.]
MTESIKQVAKRYDVTVATLHYYDEIGLLPRLTRDPHGYRQFTDADCSDLEMIICLRHLGLGVKEIASVMQPAVDADARQLKLALIEKQKQRLLAQQVDLQMGLLMITIKAQIYSHPDMPSKVHARKAIRQFVQARLRPQAPPVALTATLAGNREAAWFMAGDVAVIDRAVRLYQTVQ